MQQPPLHLRPRPRNFQTAESVEGERTAIFIIFNIQKFEIRLIRSGIECQSGDINLNLAKRMLSGFLFENNSRLRPGRPRADVNPIPVNCRRNLRPRISLYKEDELLKIFIAWLWGRGRGRTVLASPCFDMQERSLKKASRLIIISQNLEGGELVYFLMTGF